MRNRIKISRCQLEPLLEDMRRLPAQRSGECLTDDQLVSYALGTLDRQQTEEVNLHLAACDDCASAIEHLLEQRELGRAAVAGEIQRDQVGEAFAEAPRARMLADAELAEEPPAPVLAALDPTKSSFWPMTVWPDVQAAARDVGKRPERLNDLLLKYQRPLRAYLLRQFKSFPQVINNADDLLQEFARKKLLTRGWLAKARQEKGRFRSFLKTSLRYYIISWGKKAGLPQTSLDELEEVGREIAAPQAEEGIFDLNWTKEVLTEALERMERDCKEQKRGQPRRGQVWELFRSRMLDPIFQCTKPVPYEELHKRFGLKSPTEGTNMLLTAKRMYKRHLENVIAEYEGSDAAAKSELAALTQFVTRLSEKK